MEREQRLRERLLRAERDRRRAEQEEQEKKKEQEDRWSKKKREGAETKICLTWNNLCCIF